MHWLLSTQAAIEFSILVGGSLVHELFPSLIGVGVGVSLLERRRLSGWGLVMMGN